jgi:hypothetical protein
VCHYVSVGSFYFSSPTFFTRVPDDSITKEDCRGLCTFYGNCVSYIYYESGGHCDLGGCLQDTQELCSTSSNPVPVYNSDTSTPGYISDINVDSVEQKFQTCPPGKTHTAVWPHQRCEDCPAGTFKQTYSSIPTAWDCVDCGGGTSLALRASWTVARTLHIHSLRPQTDLCTLSSGVFTAATRVQLAQVIDTHLTRVCSQHTTFCMRVLRMHRDVHLLVTLTTLLSCAVLPVFDIAWRTTVTPSTRTDFHSRLDWGITTTTFSPPSKGCSSGGHFLFMLLMVLSRSYSPYSGEHFSPLGTLFLSVFVI